MSSETPKEIETPEVLRQKRDQLCFKCGQHQFSKAVIDAELLQWNQEILRINNELAKEPPVKIAEAPEVLPADPVPAAI